MTNRFLYGNQRDRAMEQPGAGEHPGTGPTPLVLEPISGDFKITATVTFVLPVVRRDNCGTLSEARAKVTSVARESLLAFGIRILHTDVKITVDNAELIEE